jgi:glutamyl-tRNA reductase
VAFAAVRLAQQAFAKLDEATVLLVGAGETIELAARHLAEAKVKRLLVANRTLAHAQALAAQFGGYALALADLPRHLAEADVVISATAAREPVVDAAMVRAALAQRRHRPMFLLDLAVPRDIDPAVAGLRDAFLYTVDDLEQVIEENRRSRREAAGEAEAIIDLQVGQFMAWWRAEDHQDVLKRLRAAGEAQRDEVLAKARAQLAAGKDPQQVLDFLANTLTNKLLHAPSAALRAAALAGDRELPRAAARLFDADARADAAGDARPDAPDAQPAPRP